MKIALFLQPFTYIGAIVYYYALSLTSLASTIVLTNTSMMFTFLLSLVILKSKFNASKMLGVFVATLGVFIIILSDDQPAEKNSYLGNVIGVVDAVIYSFYYIFLEMFLKTPKGKKIMIFGLLGCMGIISLSISWFMLLVSHYSGLEPLEWPPTNVLWTMGASLIFGHILFEYTFTKAVMILGALTANVSVCIIIPITIAIDAFFKDHTFSWTYFIGTVGVIHAIVSINLIAYFTDDEVRKDVSFTEDEHKLLDEVPLNFS